jgi:hypothetical protein
MSPGSRSSGLTRAVPQFTTRIMSAELRRAIADSTRAGFGGTRARDQKRSRSLTLFRQVFKYQFLAGTPGRRKDGKPSRSAVPSPVATEQGQPQAQR